MKNFIVPYPAYCLKTGYLRTFKTWNNIKGGFTIKENSHIFFVGLKYIARKLSAYYHNVLPFFIILLNISAINAQKDINYALHANIIYRFTKYIDWPDYTTSGDFIIGIVGDTPLYGVLEDFVANKTAGNRKIVIKKMSSSADFYDCSILFISEDKSKSLKKIADLTKGIPILIVSEASGLALKGSCINFMIVNEHLKLEINKTNIEDRKLNIASELLSLGTLIK